MNKNTKTNKILIIGSSGSGKTYISSELRKQNINAVDADLVSGLSGWFDKKGKKVKYPDDADKKFLDSHQFLWNKNFLKEYLAQHKNIFLFGLSGNVWEMTSLFDKVFFLEVNSTKLAKNLRHKSRVNPMGKTEYQLKNALRYAKKIKNKAKKLGLTFIDVNNKKPIEIYKEIIQHN